MPSPLRLLLPLVCIICIAAGLRAQNSPASQAPKIFVAGAENPSMLFTENLGQTTDAAGKPRPDMLFTSRGNGLRVFLSANAIHYQFDRLIYPEGYEPDRRNMADRGYHDSMRRLIRQVSHRFSVTLKGANPAPRIRREEPGAFRENFYLAHCPQGITNVPAYGRVVFEDVYPGINWIIYGKEGLKYDFIVRPGADPAQIRLSIPDADASISADGSLLIRTSLGEVKEDAPVSFSGEHPVKTAFAIDASGLLGFRLQEYDKTKALRIDPSVRWATYYGGSLADLGTGCATDSSGNIFLAGYSVSTGIATAGAHQDTFAGNWDAYIVKFNRSGIRQWATYYGGSGDDRVYGCASDSAGNVYISGRTNSTTAMATPGSHQPINNSANAFLVKFDSGGIRQWGTYYGGLYGEEDASCATDGLGNVYLAGTTYSHTDIASPGAHQTVFGNNYDAFLAKFDGSGVRQWGTYFGRGGYDQGFSCATDVRGNVYLAGMTTSALLGTAGTHQPLYGGGYDAYLVKFAANGTRQWATYFGGSGVDGAFACAADGAGSVCLAGYTFSGNGIASAGVHQSSPAAGTNSEAFLAKFYSSNGQRQWGTYFGGTGYEYGSACIADNAGNIFMSGRTSSTSGVATADALQPLYGGGAFDAYLVKFDRNGARQWATYFGGGGDDQSGSTCAIDRVGHVFMPGHTNSTSAIATGTAHQGSYGGGTSDGFLLGIADTALTVGMLTTTAYCAGSPVAIPFSSAGPFNSGNVYTAQLSDAHESFAMPVILGTLAGNMRSGTITGTIPASTPYGKGYRIRIISSDLPLAGPGISDSISILRPPQAPILSFAGGYLISDVANVLWYGPAGRIYGAQSPYLPTASGDYYVVALDSNGCSSTSDTLSLNGEMLHTGLVASNDGIAIYPNPAQRHLFVDLGAHQAGWLSLHSTSGQKLMDNIALHRSVNTIDLKELPAGLYFITVGIDSGASRSCKIILQR